MVINSIAIGTDSFAITKRTQSIATPAKDWE